MSKVRFLRIFSATIAFLFYSSLILAQNRNVTGIITDQNGKPLPNATVTVKDSRVATSTDANGAFRIAVPASAKSVIVSYVGASPKEFSVEGISNIIGSIDITDNKMNEVVVIGYGSVRKSDLTGAVSKIKREDLIRDAPTNVLQAMQGKISGVNVTQNDGAPGAALNIRVRGANSFLGSSEPLYVIDGIPFANNNAQGNSTNSTPASIGGDEKQTLNALSFINPADIESIEVLKDASATAIYGSRGANGVVLITTRKGRVGKDVVEVNMTVGMSEVSKRYSMLNAFDYATYANLALTNANKYGVANYTPNQFPYPGDSLVGADGKKYYAKKPEDFLSPDSSKDWQDEIFRRGLSQNYSVNISGGNNMGSHSISFNYINQLGIILNSDHKRYSLNFFLQRNLGKYLKIGTSTSLGRSTTNGVKTGTEKYDDANAGVVRAAISYPTTISTVVSYGDAKAANSQGFFITNPSIYVKDVLNRVKGINLFSSNFAEVTFLKNFTFRQNLGFNYSANRRDQYYPRSVYEGYVVNGDGLKADDEWNSVTSESIFTFNKKIEKHSITAMAAGTYELTNSFWKTQEARDFTTDFLKNEDLGSAKTQVTPQGSKDRSTLVSFLGRINYSYDNRYLLTISGRRDGSSKFGKNFPWATFPSMAFAWKIINEKFLKDKISNLSDLKLRLSYGQTGNQGIAAYSSLSKLVVYKYPIGGILQTGYADDYWRGPKNDSLRWETTTAYNGGLDLGLFNNRFTLTFDAYYKKTKDLLQYVLTPPQSGFPHKLVNAGTVENKGIEITIAAVPVTNKEFEWNTNFNISFNRNKILSLGSETERQFASKISTGDAPFIQIVGHPIGAIYGWVEDGYYDNEAEVRNDPQFTNATASLIKRMIGEIKYRNLDKDPATITETDRTFIGNVNPKFTAGFTNNFKYKNFDLSIFINGSYGNDIINMNTRYFGLPGDFKNIPYSIYNGAWREGQDNSNATAPKIIRDYGRQTARFTRRYVEDGSFARVKNVTLGYNVKTKVASIQSLRVAFGINNLYTLTNYSGYDPEVNSYGNNTALYGVDLGGYPNSRTYNISLRCTF